MATLDLALTAATTAAALAAQFAPIPYIYPCVEILASIIQLCQNVSTNRRSVSQLADRCRGFLESFSQWMQSNPSNSNPEALQAVMKRSVLEGVRIKMDAWTRLDRFRAFAKQNDIQEDIQRCHRQMSDCLAKFQVVSHLEIHEWQKQFEKNYQQDQAEVIAYLATIDNSTAATLAATLEGFDEMREFMRNMQTALPQTDQKVNKGLQSNLYQVQKETKTLLPEFNLRRGEVSRIGEFPVSGSASMDIWEGTYLSREKVAVKVIRAVTADPRSLQRFKREVKIWGDVWKIDGGQHILPFYGFCQNDGPYPYMVSPWQVNGTAISYVKRYPQVDYRDIIRKIGAGISILHSMQPPIVHGDIKGANIVINSFGDPLIADFGVSRIVEDITGVPFSQSNGVSDSYRWFAPELCIGPGSLSISSDVYAYAMTMLELLTNQQPYAYIKHTTEVVIKSAMGARPRRPTDPQVIARGLDDSLWQLMGDCWGEQTTRPSIQGVLDRLPRA
ncbi:kinase-like protein [Athelia psychrophila]|uniref:Kinase-like protein n=1 Tax=Athelia psychrophila TaxID=1759441 RepID=A0A166N2C0_9AGAM|nr:kinase-like protein [Fibularhizoctonia sp. CBS 109695]